MKKSNISFLIALCFVLILPANAQFGKLKLDTKELTQAASEAVTAFTLSDAEVTKISKEYVTWSDANNPICDTSTTANWKEYAARLERVAGKYTKEDGLKLNYKSYCVTDQNAFSCADGSIRIFAGLMDMMTDEELLGIIGHEIGHIKNSDSKDAMKQAYFTTATKGAIASTGSDVAKLTDSQIGKLGETLVGAQYSQSQEYAADEYGYNFLKKHGFDPKNMASALQKLQQFQESTNKINQLFSTHPDSGKRAKVLENKNK